MVSAKRLSVLLSYLVGLGCFFSLQGIAEDVFLFLGLFLFLIGLLNDLKWEIYPPRWVLTLIGFAGSFLFLSELSLDNAIKPFAHVLLLLLLVKALEEKKPRDIHQILLLSLFGVAVSTTFRLDISFLAFFLYQLFLGGVAFLMTNLYANVGEEPVPKEIVRKYLGFSLAFTVFTGLLSIPFFLLLPRTHTPLFDVFARKERGLVSGIAESVELGKVGEIQQDNTVVMRVYGELPEIVYWRVSVFDTFVGTRWVKTQEEEAYWIPPQGETLTYTVLLEPTYDTYIPLIDYPLRILSIEGYRGKILKRAGGVFEGTRAVSRPIRYKALSILGEPADPPQEIHLQVPPEVPERIRRLAKKLSERTETPEEKIEAVVRFFKEGFRYSLKLPPFEGDPLEHFLFESKEGNCEFFASSTALLLRLMGVPARLVGGYKGYLRNDFGRYYIVTNSMAHVWVEAYVKGRWVRVDTTPPYVSPGVRRISKLDLLRDAVISFWYENVVDFSAEKQVSMLRSLRFSLRSLKKGEFLSEILPWTAPFIVAILGFYLYTNYLRRSPENLYRRMIRRLERAEGVRLEGLLPEEVLKFAEGKPYYRDVEFIVRLYQRHRYGPYPVSSSELREGYRVLRNIY